MLIQATQLRPGMVLEYNNDLWRVMTITHITPGNWRGMVQTKLRNIKSGSQTENRFRSEDRVERIILSQVMMQFLYQDGDDYHFMNTENYEQITIPRDLIEDVAGFLTPNMEVQVEFHETTPLNVTPPKTVDLKVERTDPGMKNAAVTNTLKSATMETGLVVQVPHFVNEGEVITINTETHEYAGRGQEVTEVRPPRERGAAPGRPRPFPRTVPARATSARYSHKAEAKERTPLRSAAPALRAGPGVYIVQTQPGFESIAWSEIVSQIPYAHKLGTRTVPERAGMLVFEARQAGPLRELRCAEDLFSIVAYRRGLDNDKTSLDKVRATVRGSTHLDDALKARVAVVAGARAGKKLRFKVIARLSGEHDFRRVDYKHAIETGILERGDHAWRLDENDAEVEFWATMLRDEFIFTLRLSDDSMRFREYKISHRPGSLRPSVAAALARLSSPSPDDVFLDPLCGTATVLIERAHCGRYAMLLGGDSDRDTIEAARENIGPRYKPIEIRLWDAAALPLETASVDKIVSNLPWGMKHGSHSENRGMYPRLISEFRRVLKPGGTMVLLSAETRLMSELWSKNHLRPSQILRVTVLGAAAAIYVCSNPK